MKVIHDMQKIGRILLFGVGFAMPFNNVGFGNLSFGFLYIILYILFVFKWKPAIPLLVKTYGIQFYLPFLYFILLTIVNFYNYDVNYDTPIFDFTLFACLLFFISILLHGVKDPYAISLSIYGLALGSILMSFFYLLDIGTEMQGDTEFSKRLSMFGENSNALGIYMCIGINILLYKVILSDCFGLKLFRFAFLPLIWPIITLVIATGSRTAFIIFIISVFFILMVYPYKRGIYRIIIIAIGIIIGIFLFENFLGGDTVLALRMLKFLEEGSVSGRDYLAQKLIIGFYDNPIFGIGETGYTSFAINAVGSRMSPHNVFVEVLVYTGVCGFILWLLFWLREIKSALRIFFRQKDLLPVLMLFPILAALTSGQLLNAKWSYLLFAYFLIYDKRNKILKNTNKLLK